MTWSNNLFATLSREDVPYQAIETVCDFNRGKWIKANALIPGPFPVVTSGQRITEYHNEFNRDGESITIASSGAYAGFVNYWNQPIYLSNAFTADAKHPDKLLPKFLFYILKDKQSFIHNLASTGGVPNVYGHDLSGIQVPVPSISIQEEIVSILDTFIALEAALEAELEARTKQFDYFRNNLLTFDEDEVPSSVLSDIYEFQYGKGNTIPTTGGEFPIYGSNGVVGLHHEFNSEDAPVIGHIGAYAGIVNWAKGKHFVTYNGVICRIKDGNDPRFGYHLLMKQNLRELANEGSQPFVSYETLKNVQVQLPNIERQTEIATLLDNLDSFVNDISVGLPAEIKARRQQFEHYRNKLLTFKEPSVA